MAKKLKRTIKTLKHLYMIQVNCIQFNDGSKNDLFDQSEFPMDTDIPTWTWTDNLQEALNWYNKVKPTELEYIEELDPIIEVSLYHCESHTNEFKKNWGVTFNLKNEETQLNIGYEVDFGFNEIARRRFDKSTLTKI